EPVPNVGLHPLYHHGQDFGWHGADPGRPGYDLFESAAPCPHPDGHRRRCGHDGPGHGHHHPHQRRVRHDRRGRDPIDGRQRL
ncbi:uncharacterized protein METZ01_LOCUS368117, partial [marine metagenome]